MTAPKLGPNVTIQEKKKADAESEERSTPLILCTQFGPLTFDSELDSDQTVDDILVHNAQWEAACTGKDDDNE